MEKSIYQNRLEKCAKLMKEAGLDVLLLAKPANMAYLTGDGRLCAYAVITQNGKVALGVPKTDVEDVKSLACFDHIVGFDDEVGMIHSIINAGIQQLPKQNRYSPQTQLLLFAPPEVSSYREQMKKWTAYFSHPAH